MCCHTLSHVGTFAFDLFDSDGDGVMTATELRVMFHELYWYGRKAVEDDAVNM